MPEEITNMLQALDGASKKGELGIVVLAFTCFFLWMFATYLRMR